MGAQPAAQPAARPAKRPAEEPAELLLLSTGASCMVQAGGETQEGLQRQVSSSLAHAKEQLSVLSIQNRPFHRARARARPACTASTPTVPARPRKETMSSLQPFCGCQLLSELTESLWLSVGSKLNNTNFGPPTSAGQV